MKHLSNFKVLEDKELSKDILPDRIIDDIGDMVTELKDDGFNISYGKGIKEFNIHYPCIHIQKWTDVQMLFCYEEISNFVERLVSYLKNEGYGVKVLSDNYQRTGLSDYLKPITNRKEPTMGFVIFIVDNKSIQKFKFFE